MAQGSQSPESVKALRSISCEASNKEVMNVSSACSVILLLHAPRQELSRKPWIQTGAILMYSGTIAAPLQSGADGSATLSPEGTRRCVLRRRIHPSRDFSRQQDSLFPHPRSRRSASNHVTLPRVTHKSRNPIQIPVLMLELVLRLSQL